VRSKLTLDRFPGASYPLRKWHKRTIRILGWKLVVFVGTLIERAKPSNFAPVVTRSGKGRHRVSPGSSEEYHRWEISLSETSFLETFSSSDRKPPGGSTRAPVCTDNSSDFVAVSINERETCINKRFLLLGDRRGQKMPTQQMSREYCAPGSVSSCETRASRKGYSSSAKMK
jgi:hypothetical protein